MTRPLTAVLLAAAVLMLAPARAEIPLKRLFTTPAERARIDAARGASAAAQPGQAASTVQDPALPPGPATALPSGAVPDLPPNMTPEMMSTLQNNGPLAPGMTPPVPPGMAPPGMAAPAMPPSTDAATPAPAANPPLVLGGVLKSSHGATTVWLNETAQTTSRANARGAVSVTLPSGKRIMLKPGQRYDFNEGRVKDVGQP
jgi:hypothetical protein